MKVWECSSEGKTKQKNLDWNRKSEDEISKLVHVESISNGSDKMLVEKEFGKSMLFVEREAVQYFSVISTRRQKMVRDESDREVEAILWRTLYDMKKIFDTIFLAVFKYWKCWSRKRIVFSGKNFLAKIGEEIRLEVAKLEMNSSFDPWDLNLWHWHHWFVFIIKSINWYYWYYCLPRLYLGK